VRVFLDTNVLVAAFATRGLCAEVMRVVLAEHVLVTSDVVLGELRRALRKRIKLPQATIDEILALLRAHDVVPKPAAPSDVPLRDPDDRWILASAMDGRADVLVTGDRDLLAAADAAPPPIVDPRGFWNRLREAR
jgi:putative PIN family toxin of toxin-antitoxin system